LIQPSRDGTFVYFSVHDLEEVLAKVHANGGLTLKKPMSIGEYGWIAHFEDSEGNRVGLHRWK
jgi:predicted enzyme related to lactoylglutathione lyase